MNRIVSPIAAALFAVAAVGAAPAAADSIASTNAYLPAVNITGATGVFRTDVWIFNPETTLENEVSLYFTPAGVDGSSLEGIRIDPPLAPRESVSLTDIVRNYFQGSETFGLLEVRAAYPVMVTSNTYNVAGAQAGHLRPVLPRAALPERARVRRLRLRGPLRDRSHERPEPPDERRRHEPVGPDAGGGRAARRLRRDHLRDEDLHGASRTPCSSSTTSSAPSSPPSSPPRAARGGSTCSSTSATAPGSSATPPSRTSGPATPTSFPPRP